MSDASAADEPSRTRLGLPFGMQFSLAELLLIAAFACVGIAAAKTGGVLAWLFAEATIVLFVAFIVTAIIARCATQAFAIGFVLGVAAHAACLLYFGASEFEPNNVQLPFSKIVAPLWTALEPEKYVVSSTGETVPRSEVEERWVSNYTGQQLPWHLRTTDGSSVEMVERPSRADFMLVAHTLGSAAAGYLMGKLAAILFRRRERMTAEAQISS